MQHTSSGNSRANPSERFDSEFRLALACARWPLYARDREDIARLADASLDWARFTRIIERNQMLPLAYRNLNESLPRATRPKTLDALRRKAMGLTSRSLAQAAELVRIAEAVKEQGVEIAALKGVTLSALAYGNLAMRSPGDIDLLVAPAHVFEVERALLGLGYIRVEPKAELTPRRLKHYLKYYKHFAYFSAAKGLPLELHWRLYHNTPLTKFYAGPSDTLAVPLGSGSASTLPHNELFLYLCVHGSLHGWPILKWLADIGAMLREMDAETLARIVALASKQGLSAELQAALILVDELLAIERPPVKIPAASNPITERIVAMAHRLLTAEGYCLDIDRLPRMGMFFYDLRLRSSWRYRSRDIGRALVLPEDWELVDLPDALFPLYAALRPVSWLLRRIKGMSRRRSAVARSSASTPNL
jgi:hypothetical protein